MPATNHIANRSPANGLMGRRLWKPKFWDVYKDDIREPTVGSAVKTTYLNFAMKVLKAVTLVGTFCVVLGSAVVSKGTTLFMTSQIKKNITRPYCNAKLDRNLQFTTQITEEERVSWIWLLIFSFFIPESLTFLRSLWKCAFKSWKYPTFPQFLSLLITELCPAIGTAILIFVIFPEIDVIKAAMLTNAICFVPGILAMFSRELNGWHLAFDILSIVAQASSFILWPLLEDDGTLFLIPVAVVLISLGWWENFISNHFTIESMKKLALEKKKFNTDVYFSYLFVIPFKCLVFLATTIAIFYIREGEVDFLFSKFHEAFQDHPLNVSMDSQSFEIFVPNSSMTNIYVWIINWLSTYIGFAFAKFACKVKIHEIGFAFPVNLAVPVLVSGLVAMCEAFSNDNCVFQDIIPPHLFFNVPVYFIEEFISKQHAWVWLTWLLSQAWITAHIWSSPSKKFDKTEKIFVKPAYDAFLIDQSLALNRRRETADREDVQDQEAPQRWRDMQNIDSKDPDVNEHRIKQIYACGTMWHEEGEEMLEFLKSIMRLDEDQSAHEIVRGRLFIHQQSHYKLESHIFFDQAFEKGQLNKYVHTLIGCLDKAASEVHSVDLRLKKPTAYTTPYGGRLVWTLPGKTQLFVHLKDAEKIMAKKRWSQCMYMYYLLGFRLLNETQNLDDDDKLLRERHTYILALDGDIDFQPSAVHRLVEYMEREKYLGAACGRIHPIGNGMMAWYQKFEYAVGHWLQKATEHVIGCVLCSPGCFSLYRAGALIDKGVLKKYTTRSTHAKDFIQFDQGEDRWLCTLLLKRGYRIEYSAASDSYTHCPLSFRDFFIQRRRWMPSTTANIIDLLTDYKHVIKKNQNISLLYIVYQTVLLVGTVISPGTIFLMLVGSLVTVFQFDQWTSLALNLVPVVIFIIICATCKEDTQILFAGIISAVYALVMMAVIVGVILQMTEDGLLAPSSLFFFFILAEFVIAGILHPKEIGCLLYGVIYYITVPSMYMLLVIYSAFNMNNVSWGTRDTKSAEEKASKSTKFQYLGVQPEDNKGAFEFSLNKLFKIMCCTYRNISQGKKQLYHLQKAMEKLDNKLDGIESNINDLSRRINGEIEIEIVESLEKLDHKEDEKIHLPSVVEPNNFFENLEHLNKDEEQFWKELIETYLKPEEKDEKSDKNKIKELKDLRDKVVFTFLMLNSLFVVAVFLLTLKKDIVHFDWPFDPKATFSYNQPLDEITIEISYLQLEPIGIAFLILFASLLIVQFFGMLVHRFATFSQLIASTSLKVQSRDPLVLAKRYQNLREEAADETPVERRQTLSNLRRTGAKPEDAPSYFLEEAFDKHSKIDWNSPEDKESTKEDKEFIHRRETIMKRRNEERPLN